MFLLDAKFDKLGLVPSCLSIFSFQLLSYDDGLDLFKNVLAALCLEMGNHRSWDSALARLTLKIKPARIGGTRRVGLAPSTFNFPWLEVMQH